MVFRQPRQRLLPTPVVMTVQSSPGPHRPLASGFNAVPIWAPPGHPRHRESPIGSLFGNRSIGQIAESASPRGRCRRIASPEWKVRVGRRGDVRKLTNPASDLTQKCSIEADYIAVSRELGCRGLRELKGNLLTRPKVSWQTRMSFCRQFHRGQRAALCTENRLLFAGRVLEPCPAGGVWTMRGRQTAKARIERGMAW